MPSQTKKKTKKTTASKKSAKAAADKSAPVDSSVAASPPLVLPSWLQSAGPLIIDANNLRGALNFEYDVVDLCAVSAVVARVAPAKDVVVCVDHGPAAASTLVGEVVVSFSGPKGGAPYASADDMIVSDVGRLARTSTQDSSNRLLIVVVTADRELTKRCKFICHHHRETTQLVVVPSAVFADWLYSSNTLDDEMSTPPFGSVSEQKEAVNVEDDWLPANLMGKKANRRRPSPAKNSVEGTPSRALQAAGLHKRLMTWAARQPSCSSDDSPTWVVDYLQRHPWPGKI